MNESVRLRSAYTRSGSSGVGASPRVLVVNDSRERSGGLAAALRRQGASVAALPLAAIAFDSSRTSGLMIPGFSYHLPDAVLVRSIAAGSFEVITRRLGVLHALAKLSVPVWNSAQAIERCVDKSMTTFLLIAAGLPVPPTFAVEGRAEAERLAERELRRAALVVKPLFGAQGRGIRLVRAISDLPDEDAVSGVYYLQHYVPRAGPPYRDYRVFVCAGKVPAMMTRRGEDWVTNVTRGAVPEPAGGGRQPELTALAVAAAEAVGADFAGVDIVEAADGRLYVIEVNSMPAWSGLQSVSAVSIADTIAAALLDTLAVRNRQAQAETMPALRLAVPADA